MFGLPFIDGYEAITVKSNRDSPFCGCVSFTGLVVTQKVAAQALPVVGALGGAAVNYAFIEHFQDVARGHFTVRRLERLYGKDVVRAEYDRIARQLRDNDRA
jgi:hypothetical protein